MTRLLPTLLVVAILSACSRSGSTGNGGLITDRGTFPSPSGSSQLVIGSKPKSLVDYKIVNVETSKESAPDRLFSHTMRWAAFWQDDDTLWVHSSDIGLSVGCGIRRVVFPRNGSANGFSVEFDDMDEIFKAYDA